MARLPPRLLGIVLLACSGGSTLAHRSIYEAARHGPARFAEVGLTLLSFMLAGAGILLLIHGARLFRPANPPGDDAGRRTPSVSRPRPQAPVPPRARAFDTRRGAAMMRARHAIASSRQGAGAHRSTGQYPRGAD